MSVWCGDVGCCAVMFPGEVLDLLTACLQTVGRKIFAVAVPFNSFHPSHTLILFLFGRGGGGVDGQLATSGSTPWFYQAEKPIGGRAGRSADWLVFTSFLFRFLGNSPLSTHWDALRLP